MDEPNDRSLAGLKVPGWLTVVVLSPLLAMVMTLWLEDSGPPALLVGLAISVAGASVGASFPKGTARERSLRAMLGAAVGLAGFAAVFGAALGMTVLAKGL